MFDVGCKHLVSMLAVRPFIDVERRRAIGMVRSPGTYGARPPLQLQRICSGTP